MSTRDVIVTAAAAVVLGIAQLAFGPLYTTLSGALGPIWVMLFLGFYYLPGIVLGLIIRKPGAALGGSVAAALVQVILGSPFGILALAAGASQGAGAELVFALFRYRRWSFPVLALAAVGSGVTALIYEYFTLGYANLEWWIPLAYLGVRIPSAIVLAAALGLAIYRALERSGAVRSPARRGSADVQTGGNLS